MSKTKAPIAPSDVLDQLWEEMTAEDRAAFLRRVEARDGRERAGKALLVEEDQLYLSNDMPARLRIAEADGAGSTPFRRHAHADEGRFAHYFGHVWREIPSEDRACMLRAWRPGGQTMPPENSPRIQLVDAGLLPNGWLGCCSDLGGTLRFDAVLTGPTWAYQLPHVIAHELAHAYRNASGDRFRLSAEILNGPAAASPTANGEVSRTLARRLKSLQRRAYIAEEKETNRVAERWGFRDPRRPRRRYWEWL